MRLKTNGMLLPAVALTVLASLGVGALLATGVPVLPAALTSLPSSDRQPERRGVAVSPTPSPRPRTPSPAATTHAPAAARTTGGATSGPGPVRTSGPAPTTGPATKAPATKPAPSQPKATERPAKPAPPRATAAACRAGSKTVYAVADAYVDQSAPGQRMGGPALLVASRDKNRNKRALVRFSIPAVPSGCTLRGATLRLTAKEATGRRLVVARAGSGWSESTVTWSTAPRPAGAATAATLSSTTATWDVTGHVAAGASRGFVVYDAAESSQGSGEQTNLNGRDSRTPPALTIRWS